MKTALSSLTLLLLAAKLALTATNGVLWPLSGYPMFSHPLHEPGRFLLLDARLDDGSRRLLYPWSLLPLDVYRSSRLLQSAGESRPAVLAAIKRWAAENPRGWRSAGGDRDRRSIESLELASVPLETALEAREPRPR